MAFVYDKKVMMTLFFFNVWLRTVLAFSYHP